MKRAIKHPDRAASTGAYSDGVIVDGWLYISGQGPLDLATGQTVPGTIEEETRRTLSHIGKILEAAGVEFFRGIRPARTTVQSAGRWNQG